MAKPKPNKTMNEIKAEIVGDNLVVSIPMAEAPSLSSTGRSHIIATTHGWLKTELEYANRKVSISLTACVPVRERKQ